MNRQQAAVARLEDSRLRLRSALAPAAGTRQLGAELLRLVQQHPWLSLLLSGGLGAVLVRAQPWRWMLRADLWKALLPGLLGTLAPAPLGNWVDVFTLFARQAAASQPAAAQSPVAPS